MNRHANGTLDCPRCEEYLATAHETISDWFKTEVKPKFQDCHVCQAWRGEKDQNQDFAEGKSKLKWPMSMHNKLDDQGNPCSMALDLFRLASNGMACWEYKYFREIADETYLRRGDIIWGGDWGNRGVAPKFVDDDHFELHISAKP